MIVPIITLAILSMLSAIYTLLRSELHVDILFFLYKSKLFENGKELFIDYFDINSPFMFDYNILIFRLSKILNIQLEVVFIISSIIIVFILLVLMSFYIDSSGDHTKLQVALIIVIALQFLFSGDVFFQRDFIISLAAIIYFFSVLNTISFMRNDFSLFVGFLLGIVILIKPNYIVVPILLELGILILQR